LAPSFHDETYSNADYDRKQIEKRIVTLTLGKGIGMTDGQWNDIV